MIRLVIFCGLLSAMVHGVTNKKDWSYTVLSASTNSSDNERLELGMDVITVGRGNYAVSGFVDIKVPVDDSYIAGVNLYRSATGGNSHYQLMPLRIENQTWSKSVNGPYKEYVMDSVKECSNAPQFKDTWVGPLQPTRYSFSKCKVSIDNLPNHMHPGFYRIHIMIMKDDGFMASIVIGVKVEASYT